MEVADPLLSRNTKMIMDLLTDALAERSALLDRAAEIDRDFNRRSWATDPQLILVVRDALWQRDTLATVIAQYVETHNVMREK